MACDEVIINLRHAPISQSQFESNNLFEPEGKSVTSVFSRAIQYDAIPPSAIILTNFGDIAVFFAP